MTQIINTVRSKYYKPWLSLVVALIVFGLYSNLPAFTPRNHGAGLPVSSLGHAPSYYTDAEIRGFYPAARIGHITLDPDLPGAATPMPATGDLGEIHQRGVLRVAVLRQHQVTSTGASQNPGRELLRRYADSEGLTPAWLEVDEPADLLRALRLGWADLTINAAAQSPESNLETESSLPLRLDSYRFITRLDHSDIRSFRQMTGLKLGLKHSSPVWHQLETLATSHDFHLIEIPEYLAEDQVLDRLRGGYYDLTVLEQRDFRALLPKHPELTAVFDLNRDVPQTWLIRKGADRLRTSINRFLLSHPLATAPAARFLDDLDGIKARGVLRAVALADDTAVFLKHGRPAGFAYELLHRFTREQKLSLQVLIASDRSQALRMLSEGRVDVLMSAAEGTANPVVGMAATRPIDTGQPGWLLRADDQDLLTALNGYLQGQEKSAFYNVLRQKYPASSKTGTSAPAQGLTPYDALLHKYAGRYHFDWLLLAAQMYQESHFDPRAVSDAGAIGLMQMLPSTAEHLGFTDILEPDQGIHAGARYLHQLRERFDDPAISIQDRNWFALAAYNAGYRRIQKARGLAARMGLDENRWFGNVEQAMRAMGRPGKGYARCRCGQTVHYVRNIRNLYSVYASSARATRLVALARERENPGEIQDQRG